MKTIIYKILCIAFISFWVQNLNAQDPNWTVNTSNYQYSMTFTTFLNVDGETLTATNNKVGAFVNGEIRGVANVIYEANVNKYVAYLSVYANTNDETINFKIYNSAKDQIVTIDKNETFTIDGNIGGIFQSYSIASPALSDKAVFSSFNFSGITALSESVSSDKINIVLPKDTNLSALIPVYNSSIRSKVFVEDILQESGNTTQDFTNPIIYKVLSENEAVLTTYEVTVTSSINETLTTVTILNSGNLNTVPIPLDIIFSNDITGFDTSDFILENAIISSFTKIDSRNFKVEIIPFSQGHLSAQVKEGSTIDEDNNQNEISNKLAIIYDINKPLIHTVSVDKNSDFWWFIVDFNEDVLNVDTTDFKLKGAASNSLVISSIDAISNKQYKVNITNSNTEIGVISLQLNSDSDIEDNSGNKVILSEFEAYFLNNEVLSTENNFFLDTISIAPNPVVNLLKVSLKEGFLKQVVIFDINGKIVYSKKSNQNKMTINFENKSQGMYFLRIISDKEIQTKKIIKI